MTLTPPLAGLTAAEDHLVVRWHEPGIAHVVLSNPDQRNAMSAAMTQAWSLAMSELAERVYAAKVRADSAENAYSELKAEMLARMESDNLKTFEIPADGDRPAVSFKPDARATNTIDALKFAGMVKPSELAQCVTVQITKARDFVGKAKLDAITTSVVGTPFLAVRVIGKKAK